MSLMDKERVNTSSHYRLAAWQEKATSYPKGKQVRAKISAIVLCVLSALALTLGTINASPANATTTVWRAHVKWNNNRANWPGHYINVDVDYSMIQVYGISLDCGGESTNGYGQNWGSGANVSGNKLDWGGFNGSTGDFNQHWAAGDGGNIWNCVDDKFLDGNDIPLDPIDVSYRNPMVHYNFTTNMTNGEPDDIAHLTISMHAGWCYASMNTGDDGQITDCVAYAEN